MQVLIVADNKLVRETLVAHLDGQNHKVDQAAGIAAGKTHLERSTQDVIVVVWNKLAGDLIRHIRLREPDGHSFVIIALEKDSPADINSAIQSGADDFFRIPCSRAELVARVEGPARFRKWASLAVAQASLEATGQLDLRKLAVFQNMGAIVGEDLTGLVGPLQVSDGFQVSGELHGASIPLSLVHERAEIRVSIVVEKRLLGTLAGVLLADENSPAEALQDMIREVTNTAGGAVKRGALLEGLELTTGLPVDQAGAVPSALTRCWTIKLDGSETRIGIVGEVTRRAPIRVALDKAREGMVTTQDLRSPAGALIMPAGTRLTEAYIARAIGVLGARFVADVIDV